jgi:DNA-binding LytR/AlgR family response regulator
MLRLMKKINVLIVDDEPIARDIIRSYCKAVDYIGEIQEASDGMRALTLLNQSNVDVLFVDINMPVITGMDMVKALHKKPQIIFTTAYSEFAAEAFDINATDYLLKPISFERFLRALQKAVNTKETHQPAVAPKFLTVKSNNITYNIAENEITYCESKGNNVRIFLENKPYLDVTITTEKILTLLSDDFIRAHRSFIANKSKITGISSKKLILSDIEIPIGDIYKDRLMDFFKKKG